MSKEKIEIYKSAKLYADYIGDVICSNLTEAFHKEHVNCTESDLSKILELVKISVDQGSTQGMRGIELAIDKLID